MTDTYTGSSYLKGDTWFESHHLYAVLWEPGEYVRWYVDDILLFEVGKEALARKVSAKAAQLNRLCQGLCFRGVNRVWHELTASCGRPCRFVSTQHAGTACC